MRKLNPMMSSEHLVLLAIQGLCDPYTVHIREEIAEATGTSVALGPLYYVLDRLEDKGYVSSWLSGPTPERGGRAKLSYRIEALGEVALQESSTTRKGIWERIAETWGKDLAEQWKKTVGVGGE